nr:MAG TPA: hypothetical protein [Caudoviricetes sp.]
MVGGGLVSASVLIFVWFVEAYGAMWSKFVEVCGFEV